MKKFGPYEVVDVVAVTPSGSVMAARLPGWPVGRFAVKQINSASSEPDEPQWDSQFFLDRARIQKSVVVAGGRHWLPVHSMGAGPEGAWVVTDYVPMSAQKLIDGRVPLSAAQLQHIIDCVVKGLVELQQVRYRACGSLKPTNVLITPGDLTKTSVFLTDPAQGPGPTETSDMYALGNLIHQLVLHRPFEATKVWPLPESEEWNALGRSGREWRELCTDLLSPQPASRPRLADVCWIVRDLAPRKHVKFPGRLVVVVAAAACLVLAALISLYVMTSSARQQLARMRRVWADPLATALEDPQRRARYESDPDLKVAVEHLQRAAPRSVSIDDSWRSNLSYFQLLRLRRAKAQLEQVSDDLSIQHWQRLSALSALQQQFLGRGWNQPADFLRNLLSGVRPAVTLTDGIDRFLRVDSLIQRDNSQVNNDWVQLDKSCKQLEKIGDRTLWAFARSLRNAASASIKLTDEGFGGVETLKANAALSARLAQAVPADWPANVDVQRLAIDTLSPVNLSRPTNDDVERWLTNLPLYSIRTTETALAASALQKKLKDVEETVSKSKPTDDDRTAFDRGQEQVVTRIQSFAKTPFIEKEVESGAFAERQSAIDLEIQALRRFARAESLAELIKNLPALKTSSTGINQYWQNWKDSLAARPRPNLALIKAQAEQLRTMLLDLDQEFAAPPAGLSDKFKATALRHREQTITGLLHSLNPTLPQLDALRLASAVSSYGQWCRSLSKLAEDFPLRKQLLSADDKPDEKWAQQQGGFWDDPQIQELVKPDVQRLLSLRALGRMTRPQLVEAAHRADSAEMALSAWRLLGQQQIRPAWPCGGDELASEKELRTRLAMLLSKLPETPERKQAQSLLPEQGPIRWRSAVRQAANEQTLATAWESRSAFGMDDAAMTALSADARYNLWLWRTRQVLAANDEASLQPCVDELTKAASELKDPLASAMVVSLTGPTRRNSFIDTRAGDKVSVALLGVQPPIQFQRVQVPQGRPFYLCTTEVSLGQFVGVLDAARGWEQCRQLPWPYLEGGRRGPRVWEWFDNRLQPAQLWLGREEDNDFAPSLRAERFNRMLLSDMAGGMPSPQHPMQQISAQTALWFAAVCGCRLPTPREWQAAYNQFEKNVPQEQLNLRDLTWEIQRRYVADGRPLLPGIWPYEDIFQAEGDAGVSLASDARTHGSNDGALLFRPVSLSGGSVFHHLVGNVAEYLCDEPDNAESLVKNHTPQAILDFVGRASRSLYVIGGSALSPPNVPADKPLPVPRTDQSYCDVGLRLAVSAPPRSLAEKVTWALRDVNYRWPPQNSDAAQVKLEH